VHQEDQPSRSSGLRRLLRLLLAAVFVDLALFVAIVYAHAASSISSLVLPAVISAAALLVLSLGALGVGLLYSWRAYPQHRRAIIFVAAITLVVLLSHAYIINNPPASDLRAPVSGAVGAHLVSSDQGDGNTPLVTLDSSMFGRNLTVVVTASGSDAIADLVLNAPSNVSGPGFSRGGTFASPLEPGESVTGTWQVNGVASNLSLSYHSLNCYSTSSAEYGCIMDEIFYVPEGMALLNGQHCSVGVNAPTDCHLEHPPLVPALLAGGMAVFGQFSAVGWRFAPALLGTLSVPLIFGLAWKISGSKKLAYLSAILLSVDVMFFAQSSAALLDVPEIFFGLAAFFAYFAGLKVWKLDKYVISGAFLGLAGLAKETAIFLALALITYILIFEDEKLRHKSVAILKVVAVVGVVFIVGLQAYDSILVSPSLPGTTSCPMKSNLFIEQIGYMLCYGSSLNTGCPWACGWKDNNLGNYINPFSWITYYSPVAYLRTVVSVCPNSVNGVCQGGGYSYVSIAYYGVTNFLETWTIYVWIPLVGYALYRFFGRRQPTLETYGFEGTGTGPAPLSGELKFAAFALILFLWSYLPYVLLFFAGRVTYPFYFLPAVPAMAMGTTYWLTRSWFPRWLMYVYVVMAFVFFFIYFPYKGFLPDWLRVIIGH
jgi:4-amino-4-deoxy-L-arabinose transferase-like glycosyltransferase